MYDQNVQALREYITSIFSNSPTLVSVLSFLTILYQFRENLLYNEEPLSTMVYGPNGIFEVHNQFFSILFYFIIFKIYFF